MRKIILMIVVLMALCLCGCTPNDPGNAGTGEPLINEIGSVAEQAADFTIYIYVPQDCPAVNIVVFQ